MKHNERCRECKAVIGVVLEKIYGDVSVNHKFVVGTRPDDYRDVQIYSDLQKIFDKLQQYRGHTNFVRVKNMPRCDFFVLNPGFIVEFDESQHFNVCRKVSLTNYPKTLRLGFNREKWISLCEQLDRHDRDPPYRDEQRAWYDTLRDFIPAIKGLKPTIRLYSKDFQWCSLNPRSQSDIERFKSILTGRTQNEK